MIESNSEFRAKFSRPGQQREFIIALRSNIPLSEISLACKCSERTVRDWQREKFHMDYACLNVLCETYDLDVPTVRKIARYAHTSNSGSKGGRKTIARYGKVPVNEKFRKKQWSNWWKETGSKRQSNVTKEKDIVYPRQGTKLAEFLGVLLGDGTVAPYHVSITLHSDDDMEYVTYVSDLIEGLFGVEPKVLKRKNRRAVAVTVSRKALVRFIIEQGIEVGDKIRNKSTVPPWIFKKKSYMISCLRGLIDTDGSVFDHKYNVKGKNYVYKKISFSSASPELRDAVGHMLDVLNIKACTSGTNVRIDSIKSVEQYVKLVGFSNPKHLKRMNK